MLEVVEKAVEATRLANAAAYPYDACCGYRVTDQQLDEFFAEVVDRINATGTHCAKRDGLELAVKWTNQYSEQYKFWITTGHLRLGQKAYRATCSPAWW
jgi:hypothetical protein